MKTLGEVIKALEMCTSAYCSHPEHGDCPYLDERNDCDTRKRKLDALHYLKMYKELADDSALFAEWKENPQLTWSELCGMEGKPVWVEQCNGDTKGWLLILRTNYDVINCTTKHGNSFYLYKSSYGERWQAYRKERNENA